MTQRWRGGRDSYRPHGEPIDTSRYGVEVIEGRGSDTTTAAFVREHHYSGSYPAAVFRVGLYRMKEFVGVCVFGVPAQKASIPKWTSHEPSEGVVLSRFVLLDDVPANGETWFLGKAFEALVRGRPSARVALSYADPVPRFDADGRTVMPGHLGTIYQAFNGDYHGRSKKETQWFGPDGRLFDRRSFSKIRNGESGAAASYERLRAKGARAKKSSETWAEYILAVKEESFRKVRHPGNHVYTWALVAPFDDFGRKTRKRKRRNQRAEIMERIPLPFPELPYPKTVDRISA
jgi:hypothetical protein